MENGSVTHRASPKDGMENDAFEMNEANDSQNVNSDTPKISSLVNDHSDNKIDPFRQNEGSLQRKKKKRVSLNIPEDEDSSPTQETGQVQFKALDYDPNAVNIVARVINGTRLGVYNLIVQNKLVVKKLAIFLIFILYNAYLVTAIAYNRRNELEWEWCDGHGLLIILTGLAYWGIFYYHILKRFFGKAIYNTVIKPIGEIGNSLLSRWYIKALVLILIVGGIVAFIVIDAWDTPKRMISALGVIVMVLLGLVFSKHPGRVQWRQVFGGMGVQFVFGLLTLRWKGGRDFLDCVSEKVTRFLAFSMDGSNFIYGYLSSGSLTITNSTVADLKNQTIGFQTLFAFQALSVIYFFSFFVGLLYHLGIMTWVVSKVGWVLQVLLRTTAAESMNAAANIFLGQTEAPLLIKPFLNDMTRSEIHAVMTGGFATIAGSVMAAYIGLGVTASSLLTASVMAAPAALAFSKLLYPETKVSKTSAEAIKLTDTKGEGNALDAAAQGAAQGFILIGNIVANLIAVISFVAFLNAVIAWFGFLVGQPQLSFEWILGKIFIPFAICLGVDSENTEDVALLLGLKTVVNEFVAYERLLKMPLTPRSRRIAEYALCSFANFSSVGIQLGGFSVLAPLRRVDFSKVVWSALLAGTLTSMMNACVAGALISNLEVNQPIGPV